MWIVVESGDLEGKAFELANEHFVVGRDPSCDLALADSQVSSQHLRFTRAADGGVTVEDLGSTNGTIIDGRRLAEPVALSGGEHIRIGRTVLTLARSRPGETSEEPGEAGGAATVIAPAAGAVAPAPAEAAAAEAVPAEPGEPAETLGRPPAPAPAAAEAAEAAEAEAAPAEPGEPAETLGRPSAPDAATPVAAVPAVPPADQDQTPAGPPLVEPIPPKPAPAVAAAAATTPADAADGAPPAVDPFAARGASPSSIERAKLRRSVNSAVAIAIGAIAIAAVAVVLALTGVLGGGSSLTVAQVVQKVSPSTLLVVASQNGQPAEKGTAWVLDAKAGLVVTNNHVAQGGNSLSVGTGGTPTGTVAMTSHGATIVGTAPCQDIAVLHVSGIANLPSVPLANQSDLQSGDGVIALGFPVNASLDDNLVTTSGIVSTPMTQFSAEQSGADDVPDLPNVVQTTAPINPGNSGGPLVNYSGELVGMDSAGLDQNQGRTVQGEGYAIGSNQIKKVVATLRTGHSIGWAGFGLDYPDPNALQEKGLPPGLIVNYTEPGSPASQISVFQNGPVLITSINGHQLDTTLESYCDAVQGIDGQTVPVTVVLNDGTQGTVQVPFE